MSSGNSASFQLIGLFPNYDNFNALLIALSNFITNFWDAPCSGAAKDFDYRCNIILRQ